MGRPSDRKRSARRPGKRQRARVKKPRRPKWITWTVVGGDLVMVELCAGQKKRREAHRSHEPGEPLVVCPSGGDPYLESGGKWLMANLRPGRFESGPQPPLRRFCHEHPI